MTTDTIRKQIEGLEHYMDIMTLDVDTCKAFERVIHELEDTLIMMIEFDIKTINEV